ncbi:MAG: hypothetical protein JO034_03530 [Singulisphaera sp.]|nr:hypothetical protein [Singulisphaera sp.]
MEKYNTSRDSHQQYSQGTNGRGPGGRQPSTAPPRRPSDDDRDLPAAAAVAPPDPVDSEAEADDLAEFLRKRGRPAPLYPFARFVLDTFLWEDCHDRATLQCALMGPPGTATFLAPRNGSKKARDLARRTNQAYRLVAQEVLSVLHSSGHLRKDSWGWLYPTIRGTEGLPPRRRAELYLRQLSCEGVHVSLKDGRPVFNAAKKTDPNLSEGEIRGGLALFRAEIVAILRERATGTDATGETGGER